MCLVRYEVQFKSPVDVGPIRQRVCITPQGRAAPGRGSPCHTATRRWRTVVAYSFAASGQTAPDARRWRRPDSRSRAQHSQLSPTRVRTGKVYGTARCRYLEGGADESEHVVVNPRALIVVHVANPPGVIAADGHEQHALQHGRPNGRREAIHWQRTHGGGDVHGTCAVTIDL